jgi:hypothetical protein
MRKNTQTSLETSAHLCGLYQPRGRLMPRGGRPEKSQVSIRCSGASRWRQSVSNPRARTTASRVTDGWPEVLEKRLP